MFNTVENNVQNNVQSINNEVVDLGVYVSEDGYVIRDQEEFDRSYMNNRLRLLKQIYAYVPVDDPLSQLLREDISILDCDYDLLTKRWIGISTNGDEHLLRVKISLMNEYQIGCTRCDDEEFIETFVNHLEKTKKELEELTSN